MELHEINPDRYLDVLLLCFSVDSPEHGHAG